MPVSDQGINLEKYMLIPRTLIFLRRADSILLIKGAPSKRLWAGLYNGIGGHIEPGEDVLSAAYRELDEETQLKPESLWLCATVTIDTGQNPGIVLFVFMGECAQGEPVPSAEGSLEWVPLDRLNELPLVEDLPALLGKILGMRNGQPAVAAHYAYDEHGKMLVTFYG
jgi:8-oxo-dGTP diphosphatase